MIDLKIIRTDLEKVKDICKKRGCEVDIDRLAEIDQSLRNSIQHLNDLQAQKKVADGVDARQAGRERKELIAKVQAEVDTLTHERDILWSRLPNLLPDDTPSGDSDADNVELRKVGDLPTLTNPQAHDEIGVKLKLIDFKHAIEVAGTGFYYWTGMGARLSWGMFSLALDFLDQRGFTRMFTPIVAKRQTLFGTGYLPFFDGEIYKIEGEDLSIIGTSEQTLVGYHANELLEDTSLPICYSAFTPCMRTEGSSGGRESRGAFRVHQFHKVEQIIFCKPDESEYWHNECQKNIEEFLALLEIPYRVVRVCTGDLGAPAYKKYDTESWFAGFSCYRETHSNTNLLDYQTRRLGIRYRGQNKGEKIHPHTISSTMATDRMMLAIIENNQQADGSIRIPKALQPYVGGQEVIEAN